jgi:hypothetical protein
MVIFRKSSQSNLTGMAAKRGISEGQRERLTNRELTYFLMQQFMLLGEVVQSQFSLFLLYWVFPPLDESRTCPTRAPLDVCLD